jgi:hypothetical protein
MITRHGMDFHVQTQDKGKTAHYVESTVYKSGRVLSSRKTFYTAILDSPRLKVQINQIIEEQHSTILQEIEEGKFDHL